MGRGTLGSHLAAPLWKEFMYLFLPMQSPN